MVEKLTLEWAYTPIDFVEGLLEYSDKDITVEIKDGRVTAHLRPEAPTDSFQEIYRDLEARFSALQLINNKPYQLSGYTVVRAFPDGSRHIDVGISINATLRMSADTPDIVIRDAAGNIQIDTKRDRINAMQELMNKVSEHRKDPVLGSVLKSYHTAVADASNDLIHLYEIRDALATKFGDENEARSQLKITKEQWNRLGYLANKAPLLQSRHRGDKIGLLRDATLAELDEARSIATLLIRAYLSFLNTAKELRSI